MCPLNVFGAETAMAVEMVLEGPMRTGGRKNQTAPFPATISIWLIRSLVGYGAVATSMVTLSMDWFVLEARMASFRTRTNS